MRALVLVAALLAQSCIKEPTVSLPASRNTTYAASSQVKSVDLNDFQDQIIALHTRLNDPRTLILPWVAGIEAGFTPFGDDAWGIDVAGYVAATAGGSWMIPIVLEAGRQITGVRVRVRSHDTGVLTATLRHHTDGVGVTDATDATVGGGGAVDETLVLTPASPVEIEAGINRQYVIHCAAAAAGPRIYMAEVDYEWVP